jgi:raffinose/stachyose/melibiose transport system permease protein
MSKIKLTSVYSTIFYVPVVATPVVVGNIFSKIFETNRGELNTILRTLNLDFLTQQWLADPKVALYAIAMVNIWQWTGYSMLVYYANMLSIPDDLYEAATIDGAGTVKKFFSITLPLLRSSHFTLFVLGALGTLKCFDLPFVLTKGGPNYATEFFSTYIYKKSFDLFDQGGASTLVVLMFIIAIIITVAQLVIYTRNDKNKEMS